MSDRSPLTEVERALLLTCASEEEWSQIVPLLKKARGGTYPEDWFEQVIAPGGIISKLRAKWNDPGALGIGVQFVDKEK